MAAGFEVIVIAQEPGVQLRDGVETAGRYMSALAAYAIRTETSREQLRPPIYVSDRLRNKLLTEKSLLDRKDAGRGAAVLAVQAVELLKASLADYWLGAARASARRLLRLHHLRKLHLHRLLCPSRRKDSARRARDGPRFLRAFRRRGGALLRA